MRLHHQQQQQQQKMLTNGGAISFDEESIATTTTITHYRNNQHHRQQAPPPPPPPHQQQQQQHRQKQHHRSSRHNSNDQQQTTKQKKHNQEDKDGDENDDGRQEQTVQVEIISQDDDNWPDAANTTAYTGATSEVSGDFNDDNFTEDGRSRKFRDYLDGSGSHKKDSARRLKTFCSRYLGYMFTIFILLLTYVTPILFIILPRCSIASNWQILECGIECEGQLIGISFKLFLVLLGVWALYLRRPKATLPRIYELRTLILFLLFTLTFSYWLFYGVRIIDTRQQDYYKILQFTTTYVDVLLFIYVISVFIMEIRQLQPQYVVKIIRSPDGIEHEYSIGKMSIQRAAVWLLEQYYKDFPIYNPWLENAHKRRVNVDAALKSINETSSQKSLKYYNIDPNNPASADENPTEGNGGGGMRHGSKSKSQQQLLSIAPRSHNDRFYEEYEYERRLRKRRARLLTATEDAFTHIKRVNVSSLHNGNQQTTLMDPFEAAQAIFTSIARDLRRYLRITRQQPYYTRDTILSHLADCVSYDMSPKTFLQRYFNDEPIIFNQRALMSNGTLPPPPSASSSTNRQSVKFETPEQSWILICDSALYQNVEDNLMIVLKQNEISLMCTFKRLPYFNLIEDILDTKRNKFVLKMNSETSV